MDTLIPVVMVTWLILAAGHTGYANTLRYRAVRRSMPDADMGVYGVPSRVTLAQVRETGLQEAIADLDRAEKLAWRGTILMISFFLAAIVYAIWGGAS